MTSAASKVKIILTPDQVSKALLVQNHVFSQQFTNRLFEVFDDSINWDAARALGEVGGSDIILTKRNHATVKV